MKVTAIDSGRIEAMMAQLKAAAQKNVSASGNIGGPGLPSSINSTTGTSKLNFADALNLHIHDVVVCRDEFVTHLYCGLK